MSDKPKPIRLTKARALALLEVFETGYRDREEAVKDGIALAVDATEMQEVKRRDHLLGEARAAAEIIRNRYVTHPPKKEADALF